MNSNRRLEPMGDAVTEEHVVGKRLTQPSVQFNGIELCALFT